MRKAVAVPYVIALILGVAVIALLGIWFVISGGKFSKQSTITECQGLIVQWCTKQLDSIKDDPLLRRIIAACDGAGIGYPTTLEECKEKRYIT